MLIVVCGMHRSGSTLVWQVARQLMLEHPGLRNPRDLSSSEFPVAARCPHDLLMVKVHYRQELKLSHFPDVGARYLYTYRDTRDVVASLFRKGRYPVGDPRRGAVEARRIARREVDGDAVWTAKGDRWVGRYESFRSDTRGLIQDLAGYLKVVASPSRIEDILAYVDVSRQIERSAMAPLRGIDHDTRMTSNHITDGREGAWRDTLTPEEHAAIECECREWLIHRGYRIQSRG
jgi:hypothetical protein